jgi:hypothetical protein
MVQVRTDISEQRLSLTDYEPVAEGPSLALAPSSGSMKVLVASLQAKPFVRLRPLDPEHVSALAEIPHRWPPIVVAAETMLVIDGVHRVAAARQLGMTSIAARFFHGDDHEAFVEAVTGNVKHGLPLSLAERRWAARRLVGTRPERSDRAIAEICGLDHKTVGRLRDSNSSPSGEISQLDTRLGRDRRARPVDVVSLRTRIASAVVESPGDSLREIARRVGASPETVRDVRARLARGDDPIPSGVRDTLPPPEPAPAPPPSLLAWVADTACQSQPEAAEFAAWFDQGQASVDWRRYVEVVPLSRVYEIADQSRAYADAWKAFAEAVERRSRLGTLTP